MASKNAQTTGPGGSVQGFLKILIASALGAALATAAYHWIGPRPGADAVDEQILAELKNISAAMRQTAAPGAPVVRAPEPPRDIRIAIENSPSRGRADAKVVMVEFSDF